MNAPRCARASRGTERRRANRSSNEGCANRSPNEGARIVLRTKCARFVLRARSEGGPLLPPRTTASHDCIPTPTTAAPRDRRSSPSPRSLSRDAAAEIPRRGPSPETQPKAASPEPPPQTRLVSRQDDRGAKGAKRKRKKEGAAETTAETRAAARARQTNKNASSSRLDELGLLGLGDAAATARGLKLRDERELRGRRRGRAALALAPHGLLEARERLEVAATAYTQHIVGQAIVGRGCAGRARGEVRFLARACREPALTSLN